MDAFNYIDGSLHCEGVSVADIAANVGSPVYIYSSETLRDHYRKLASAFGELDLLVCYSIKSLGNLSILKLLASEGSGFDVVSGGELARAQAVGADLSKIVFAGAGKTDKELTEALTAGIGYFNIESEMELYNLARLAAATGTHARAALRVNPDVFDPKTHAYTTTGKKGTKFGVDIDLAADLFARFGKNDHVSLEGIHLHIGSPIYSPAPYVAAITKTLLLIDQLRESGFEISLLDIGGGFAADYEDGKSPSASDYAAEIVPLLKDKGLRVVIEPGRHIACNAGILLTQTQYTKSGGGKNFVIVDAAMTDLLRPALYESEHFVWPAQLADGAAVPTKAIAYEAENGVKVDVVGGVCETSDVLAYGRTLPKMERGDLLAVFSAGAYGFVMSSQYNARPRAAEVLVEGDTYRVIRPRENYDDLFSTERDALK